MQIIHPIYGKGTVVGAAQGRFSWVQFRLPTNCKNSYKLPNCLAVSLNVCRRAF